MMSRLDSDNHSDITASLQAQFVAARLHVTAARAALFASLAFQVPA